MRTTRKSIQLPLYIPLTVSSSLYTHIRAITSTLPSSPVDFFSPTHPNAMIIPSNSSSGHPFSGRTTPRLIFSVFDVSLLDLLLASFVFVAIKSMRKRKRHGLTVWPFVGMLPSLIVGLQTDLYEWITGVLCRQNGTFVFQGPSFSSLNCVVTSDPLNVEHILKTRFTKYPKGPTFRDIVQDFLGEGIFNADDEKWQRQRKTASIEFHSSRFRKLTVDSLFDLVHSRLLPVLEDSVVNTAVIDLQDVLLRLTSDNICMIAFGVDPGSLRQGLPEIPFAKAFEDATEATVLRFIKPTFLWKTMRYFNVGMEKKLRISIEAVNKFAENVIQTRKKELCLKNGEETERSDILTVFMGLKDELGEPFSDKFLKDICVNFILAGRDTSSVALSWFFWLLDQNPAVEEKIVGEIRKIVGEREEERESCVVFKPEEIKKMVYLQAALSEALRLYPSVPVDHKEVIEDDEFPDGTVLKKGTKVIYSIYSMGRMESIWGKDCREYKPERWLREGRFTSESAYKFAAFNGGPRLCLGRDFAIYQMKYAAASIIHRFHVKVVEGHPVSPKLALTMYMKHGLKVKLCRRE